eukprot:CAMPEP_0172324722 /NCGR_PEP_ID=MMETSP1058-20130122/52103_1 /TAXON_ID=83371 /ORGANISM="Detonula confervacea, Strain CCMP 353" /LENGTH=116 /DNA_ID=CAMNT_0013041077 /DNA_START=12 /DNA_END=359 /DNA_ORIENTATION=+
MVNTAHVSNDLYRKVHGDGSVDLPPQSPAISSQSLSGGYAFLHLGSPSDAKVGTPIRLIPINAQNEIATNNVTETIKIHPLLLKVLLRSSNLAKRKCTKISNETDTNQLVSSRHPV